MSRPDAPQKISFTDGEQSRRPGRSDHPPRPPAKNAGSKTSLSPIKTNSSTAVLTANQLGYDDGYVDAENPQGFSASNGADVRRKKSMVRPERERIDPGHRLWHYREHAAEDGMQVLPSCEYNTYYPHIQ